MVTWRKTVKGRTKTQCAHATELKRGLTHYHNERHPSATIYQYIQRAYPLATTDKAIFLWLTAFQKMLEKDPLEMLVWVVPSMALRF